MQGQIPHLFRTINFRCSFLATTLGWGFSGEGFVGGVAAAASAPVHRGTRKLRCLRLAGARP